MRTGRLNLTTTRTISTNGVDLAVIDDGEGPPVILAHGFPELAYSWRHQIPALVECRLPRAGPRPARLRRLVAPGGDRGLRHRRPHRRSDRPPRRHRRASGPWSSATTGDRWSPGSPRLLHPERLAGVVGMSVPFLPRGRTSAGRGDAFRRSPTTSSTSCTSRSPVSADAELGGDPARTMRRLLAGHDHRRAGPDPDTFALDGRGFVDRMPEPDGLPDWLTQDELDHYIDDVPAAPASPAASTGTGTSTATGSARRNSTAPRSTIPSLFIGGSADPVLIMTPPSVGAAFLDRPPWRRDHRRRRALGAAGSARARSTLHSSNSSTPCVPTDPWS